MPDKTIHEEIESWLAADVHAQLSSDEHTALRQHLVACESCRSLQEEEKTMHQLLENTLAQASPDLAFEERMLSRFRNKVPAPEGGLVLFLANLMRMRAAQITAVAAVLLTLVQVGKMVTGEDDRFSQSRFSMASAPPPMQGRVTLGNEGTIASGSNVQTPVEAGPDPALKIHRDLINTPVAQAKQGEAKDEISSAAGGELKKELDNKLQPAAAAPTPFAAESLRQESDQSDTSSAPQDTEAESPPTPAPASSADSRKLIRNAQLDLQVADYGTAIERLTQLAAEEHGFVATQNSAKLPNGKLQGTIVIKVLPEYLDPFLKKARELGELKNQTIGTEDVSKAYFDIDARLRNARRMEERLLEMLKKNTGKVSDLLQVEKELGRVREEIEQMQGELKYYDALVQYATVTVSLAEKDLDEPAAFLLRETANLSLFSANVEKTFGEVKNALRNAKAQIVQSTLDRDNNGQATARMTLLLAPEESEAAISQIRKMGRVENFNVETERVAQNGSGMSDAAKVERDKVRLNLVISRTGEEPAVQQTTLRILTSSVTEKVEQLKTAIAKADGTLRSSTFSRNPDGQEVANLILRIPLKNYPELVKAFDQLGEVKDLNVQRNDQPGTTANRETAPAEISVQIYNPGKIVSDQTGLGATIRRTLGQGVAALMWSARMIGVAIAFLAPWILALGLLAWLVTRIAQRRATR